MRKAPLKFSSLLTVTMTPVVPRAPESWTCCPLPLSRPLRPWSPVVSCASTGAVQEEECISAGVDVEGELCGIPHQTSSKHQSRSTAGKERGVEEVEAFDVEEKGEGELRSCLTVTSSCPAGRLNFCTSQRRGRPSAWGPAVWSSLPTHPPTSSLTPTTLLALHLPLHRSEDGTGPHQWTAAVPLSAACHGFRRHAHYQKTAALRDSPHHHQLLSGKAVTPHSESTRSTAQVCQRRPASRYWFIFQGFSLRAPRVCFGKR